MLGVLIRLALYLYFLQKGNKGFHFNRYLIFIIRIIPKSINLENIRQINIIYKFLKGICFLGGIFYITLKFAFMQKN
jgi:hypothetical protein